MRAGLIAAGIILFLLAAVLTYEFPFVHPHHVHYPTYLSYAGPVLAFIGFVLFIAGLVTSPNPSSAAAAGAAGDSLAGPGPLAGADTTESDAPSATSSPAPGPAPETASPSTTSAVPPDNNLAQEPGAPTTPIILPEHFDSEPSRDPPDSTAAPSEEVRPTGDGTDKANKSSGGFCPFCGAPAEAGHKFCRSCGKPLEDADRPPA
jgi:hypothetical protein